MKRTVSFLALGLTVTLATLAACAPVMHANSQTSSGQSLGTQSSVKPLFMPGGTELATICAQAARIARDGSLLWDDSSRQHSQAAPYLIACRDFTLQNDGTRIRVQDDTLAKALRHFDPGAHFLQYDTDRAVTFPEADLVSADPSDVTAAAKSIRITLSQAAITDTALLQGGVVRPTRFDVSQPLVIRTQAPGRTYDWPEVTIQAQKGLITAPAPQR